MEATLSYEDHRFSDHAAMHAGNLWPGRLASVRQILRLSDLWRLTLQKRSSKGLVKAGAPDILQGTVLSFGRLQFTAVPGRPRRGARQLQERPHGPALAGAEGKSCLRESVRETCACEAGCLEEPVERTQRPAAALSRSR